MGVVSAILVISLKFLIGKKPVFPRAFPALKFNVTTTQCCNLSFLIYTAFAIHIEYSIFDMPFFKWNIDEGVLAD